MNPRYKPMLAKEASQPFSSRDWIFEIKWDGYRAIAYVNKDLSLRSRNGKELLQNFPELEELKQLTRNVVLDGEVVIMKDGKPNFQALQERAKKTSLRGIQAEATELPATYIVFDIIEKDGFPLLDLPLTERKRLLSEALKEGKHVVLSDFVEENGEDYYRIALERAIEGVIAKKKNSTYEAGVRSGNWLKIKKLCSCDCIIFGYTKGSGARAKSFGALILGLYDKQKKPVHIGNVGTGFSDQTLEELSGQLEKLKTQQAPFSIDSSSQVTWIKPELVCEILYQVLTNDGKLRMPRFHGLRKDKSPSECTLDQVAAAEGSLEKYRKKRDFKATAEPEGQLKNTPVPIFVVQEHHARQLHYDLRLEKDGVLKSWAVPKGIPETPSQKHLAVQVEDHPLEYATFEGEIPKGEYGAGNVRIWDKGSFEAKFWDENKIEVTLKGNRLTGRYVLVRLKKAGENNWLLLKGKENA